MNRDNYVEIIMYNYVKNMFQKYNDKLTLMYTKLKAVLAQY